VPRSVRILTVVFPALVIASVAAIVARTAGTRIWLPVVIMAGLVVALALILAAALATHAILRRRWAWAVGILVAWPVVVPFYLGALGRLQEPEV
jgi:hypothetical protein